MLKYRKLKEKATPVAKQGRKAMGLYEIARLPTMLIK